MSSPSGYLLYTIIDNPKDEEKVKLKGEVHRLIAPRDQKHQSNFVEFRSLKIVYRRYAGLFFCVCVDANDNELAYLEAIHFFVEVLDSFFGNVCELDLVFNFYKVSGYERVHGSAAVIVWGALIMKSPLGLCYTRRSISGGRNRGD